MAATRLHLVRHGEVFNPEHVLYERIPGFRLSDEGRRMARAAAEHVQAQGRPVTALVASPLQRTQESAEPFTELFGLRPRLDERVIEPWNAFAGKRMKRAALNPRNWKYFLKPSVPSWGEPFADVAERMLAALDTAWDSVGAGDVVVVSHQMPIWTTHLAVAGEPLRHSPTSRRCALSSITSFERVGDLWREVGYAEPAAGGVDTGAV
ncbi:MAG: histidine phosphatase family protein [Microbacterium sp.]